MLLAYGLAIVCLLLFGVWYVSAAGYTGHKRLRERRMGLEYWKGFLFDPKLFYAPGHTWVRPMNDGAVCVGLDDFGRRLMGGVSNINLPEAGTPVHRGEAAVRVQCGSMDAELVSPIDGQIVAVNEALASEGRALERDPYGKGWLFTARVTDSAYKRFPTGRSAREWLDREVGRLFVFLHDELGLTAADGGELVSRPTRVLSEDQWANLVRAFFAPQARTKS